MRPRRPFWLPLLLLCSARPAAAQRPLPARPDTAVAAAPAPDSLAPALDSLAPAPDSLRPAPDSLPFALGLRRLALPWAARLAAAPPPAWALGDPTNPAVARAWDAARERARRALPLPSTLFRRARFLPAARAAGELARAAAAPASAAAAADSAAPAADSAAPAAAAAGADSAASLPGVAPAGGASPNLLPDVVAQYADLDMEVNGRGELGGAWNRFRPCDPTFQLGCDPGLFPQLRPDLQFAVKVGGTISQRIHVDVDYDQRREFTAANNINVFYQGLDGELLQRVEVGDVSIALPASRYLTEGVPGGNFGFRATARHGPLSLETVFAQQKGDVSSRDFEIGSLGAAGGVGRIGFGGSATDAGGVGAGSGRSEGAFVQEQQLVLDDGDYVKGQFFFVVDPRLLAGYPQVDALALSAGAAPPSARPQDGTSIVLYRDERPSLTNPQQQGQLGYFLADATTADGVQRHSGLFRRLVPGEDYIVHSSGLWLTLRSPLRPDEALAIGYVTESGDTVGALVAGDRAAGGPTPQLRLLRGPTTLHQPGQPTWEYEMHQVYRVDASASLDPATIDLDVSLGELGAGRSFVDAGGRQVSFLRLFGMDDDAPLEKLDASRVFEPAGGALGGSPASVRVGGTFVVFPTLKPFAVPPPSASLSADAAAAALDGDANPAIYDEPDPTTRQAASRFRLSLRYRQPVDGDAASFSLGAFGIRDGSERLTLDGVPLVRGVDYVIDYDLGTITLKNAAQLIAAHPNGKIHATWESKAVFDVAPTTVAGLDGHYDLGARGGLDFVGLYRAEKALQTRPELGLEPASILMGGVSGSIDLGGAFLDRALAALPLRQGATPPPSDLRLSGEVAFSMPDPNTKGDTYLDDFEASDAIPLSLERRAWSLASRPDQTSGAEDALPPSLDVASAASLVWQREYTAGDQTVGARTALSIDSLINVAGAQVQENVLYLSLGASGGGGSGGGAPEPGARVWRGVTTVLSETGRDLTQTEYIEFYAAAPAGRDVQLVFDLGTISEDAFYFDAQGATNGTFPDGHPWGLTVLDQEARLGEGEVWGQLEDQRGLWNQACQAEPGKSYPLGDPRADCTRGNGLIDSEDLDGNGLLDQGDGPYFRYVVPLDRLSRYLVRGRDQTHTDFQLYRVPLRDAGLALNGANTGTLRSIKELRLTATGAAVGGGAAVIQIARLRLVGSRWAKRLTYGVMRGLTSDLPGLGAGVTDVRVGPVSRITDGATYASPPGVHNQLQDPTAAYGVTGVEFNEKSLRVGFAALEPGERAEVFYRYPQQPRNFLSYRDLRLWAVQAPAPAAGAAGGASGDLRFLLKVGSDPRNFYLYQSPLKPPAGGAVQETDWLPERVVDFRRWFDLRAQAEERLAARGGSGEPVEVWSDDSTYAVVLQDRAAAPNLAAVRELSLAVYNAGAFPADGELWVDELRLGAPLTDPGLAGHLDLDITAGDFLSGTASVSRRGALYRQLSTGADYQGANDFAFNGTARLGRLAPPAWGLQMPLSVQLERTAVSPFFLQQSDVAASRLSGLRPSGARRTRLALVVRRDAPADSSLLGAIVDGATLRLGYSSIASDAIVASQRLRAFDAGLSWNARPVARSFDLTPGFLDRLLRGLAPAWLERSEMMQRILGARLRWTPSDVAVGASYHDQTNRSQRFDQVVATAASPDLPAVVAPERRLDDELRFGLRPLESLSTSVEVRSGRDLLDPAAIPGGPFEKAAVARLRQSLAGLGVGWERARWVSSRLDFRPRLSSWLQPGVSYASSYTTSRSPSLLELEVLGDDTTATMLRGASAQREVRSTVRVVPAELWGGGGGRAGGGDRSGIWNGGSGGGSGGTGSGGVGSGGTGGGTGSGGAGASRGGVGDSGTSGSGGTSDSGTSGSGGMGSGGGGASRGGVGAVLGGIVRAIQPIDLAWSAAVSSRFDRATAAPGLDYQLGWGGLGAFRSIDGDTAVTALGRNLFRARSGVALPAGARVDVAYSTGTAQILNLGGGARTQDERTWPDVRLSWTPPSLPGAFGDAVDRLSLSAGYRWTTRDDHLLGGGGELRGRRERSVPLQLALGAGGLSASWTGSLGGGRSFDATGSSRATSADQAVQLAGSFLAPDALRADFPNPFRLSLSWRYQAENECRTGPDGCAAFLDVLNRGFHVTLETLVSDLQLGLQASYDDRRSFIGTRTGSSQFQLGLFGQFRFTSSAGRQSPLAPPGG